MGRRARSRTRGAILPLRPSAPTDTSGYGPTDGAAAVRAGAVPQTVTDPGGTTAVSAGSLTQALLNGAGTNASFWLQAGTHTLTSGLQPLAGQKFYCHPSAVIDGADAAGNFLMAGPAAGVEIHGGKWQRCGNASSSFGAAVAAILVTGGTGAGSWLVEDAEITDNYNKGLVFQAPSCTARRVYSHENGRYNFNSSTNGGGQRYTGIRFEYCHSKNGNTRQLDPGDDAGQAKFTALNDGYVGYCWFDDDTAYGGGYGIWFDFDQRDITVEENVCENLRAAGIFYEASFGGTVIKRNYVVGCGTSAGGGQDDWLGSIQILTSCCDGTLAGSTEYVDVYRNWVDIGSENGLALGFIFHYGHPYYSYNNRFYENRIDARGSRTGVIGGRWHQLDANTYGKDTGFNPFVGKGNTFADNANHVPSGGSGATRWQWDGGPAGTNQLKTFTQFQGYGQDASGTVTADL